MVTGTRESIIGGCAPNGLGLTGLVIGDLGGIVGLEKIFWLYAFAGLASGDGPSIGRFVEFPGNAPWGRPPSRGPSTSGVIGVGLPAGGNG